MISLRSVPRAALRRLVEAASALALLTSASTAIADNDPYLNFWTIETPHFRIHYASNIEPIAERVADLAESIHQRLTPALGHTPTELTHIVLTDNTDSANGSATSLPYNTVRLFVTAPDDMSPLGDYDDWYLELVTHEYTHILHTDNIHGVPAIANAILGKTFAPNQAQPRWLLEGLAVLEESKHTSGGRNRSAIFDMFLRADVLEGNIASIDQISHLPRRWPTGNLWYLYGSRFLTWISDTYGEQTMRAVSADYGRQIIAFGINRSVKRATGRTYVDLYPAWIKSLERKYSEMIRRAESRPGGLREGTRLTHHGRQLAHPRWLPTGARRDAKVPELAYELDDAHSRSGIFRVKVPEPTRADESSSELWIRGYGNNTVTVDREGNAIFSTTEVHKRVYDFTDLSRLPAGKVSPDGDEPERVRVTQGLRASDPDVNRDGTKVVYTVNRRGTTYLSIADVLPEGGLGPSKVLVPTARFNQVFGPRFSPDAKRVAYSAWTSGGYRDIRFVDVKTGALTELAHDRALDTQPSWAPDGKTLYFSSDRTGIHNIYAYDFDSQKLWMVTNVRTGAFMPEVAPDGNSLVYVGYTSSGFDLFAMKIDRALWTPAEAYEDDRPDPHPEPPQIAWPRHPYNPLPSLRPRAYKVDFGTGTFGPTLTVSIDGSDAIPIHSFAAAMAIDTVVGNPQFSLGYTYGRLPFDLRSSFFRTLSPRRDYRINDNVPETREQTIGWTNAIVYTVPRAFDSFQFSLGYTAAMFDRSLPVPTALDPQAQITVDPKVRGYLGVARFGFGYSNVERYLYSVGASRGFSLSMGFDAAARETASEYSFYSFNASVTKYIQTPWHRDHTILLRGSSAVSGGTYPRQNIYYVGGFVDLPPLDVIQKNLFQGGFVLRGYPANAYSGRQYHLANIEYRFPIWHPERGVSTLPAFWNRLAGLAFLDYGGAFEQLDTKSFQSQFHTGYGGELLIDTTVGYFVSTTTRLGYARGGSPEAYAGGRFYFVISSAF